MVFHGKRVPQFHFLSDMTNLFSPRPLAPEYHYHQMLLRIRNSLKSHCRYVMLYYTGKHDCLQENPEDSIPVQSVLTRLLLLSHKMTFFSTVKQEELYRTKYRSEA